jgi:hypothetical protein
VLQITRFGTGQFRPHLVSADLKNVPRQSCAGAGPGCGTNVVQIGVNGTTVTSANIDLLGSPTKSQIAGLIETALQVNRPALATTTSSTITPESIGPFQAYGQEQFLMITSGGPIPLGSEVSDYPQPPASPCCTLPSVIAGKHSCMNAKQLRPTNEAWVNIDTAQNVVGVAALYTYNWFDGVGHNPCSAVESAKAYYGLLNVHCPCTGRIQTGQDVIGTGVALYTTIWSNVSGGTSCDSNCGGPPGVGTYCLDDGCDGTTWALGGPPTAVGQRVGPEPLNTVPAAVQVEYKTPSTTYSYFEYSTHVFASGLQSISYLEDVTGNVAEQYVSRAKDQSSGNYGAWADSPGSNTILRCMGKCSPANPDLDTRLKATVDLLTSNLPGSFQTEYWPCDPTSPTNWRGGPEMLPGLDERLHPSSTVGAGPPEVSH